MDKFGDPGFYYHQTLVKIWGLITLRLTDSAILPISPGDYAETLTSYAQELSTYSSSQSNSFPVLTNAISKLVDAADIFEKDLAQLSDDIKQYINKNEKLPAKLVNSVALANKRVTYFERGFLDPRGIKDRTWFKHVIYAPGLWTGYASQIFPAIVDAVDAGDIELTKHTEERAALSIDKAREWLSAN